jgi:hypothetical protein
LFEQVEQGIKPGRRQLEVAEKTTITVIKDKENFVEGII